MTTTITPIASIGPDDDGLGPVFPSDTGRIITGSEFKKLRESKPRFPKPKVEPKKFIKAAEGVKTPAKSKNKKVKKDPKPKNLRASESKNKKKGLFGEVYKAPSGNSGKGVRVAESFRNRIQQFR